MTNDVKQEIRENLERNIDESIERVNDLIGVLEAAGDAGHDVTSELEVAESVSGDLQEAAHELDSDDPDAAAIRDSAESASNGMVTVVEENTGGLAKFDVPEDADTRFDHFGAFADNDVLRQVILVTSWARQYEATGN